MEPHLYRGGHRLAATSTCIYSTTQIEEEASSGSRGPCTRGPVRGAVACPSDAVACPCTCPPNEAGVSERETEAPLPSCSYSACPIPRAARPSPRTPPPTGRARSRTRRAPPHRRTAPAPNLPRPARPARPPMRPRPGGGLRRGPRRGGGAVGRVRGGRGRGTWDPRLGFGYRPSSSAALLPWPLLPSCLDPPALLP